MLVQLQGISQKLEIGKCLIPRLTSRLTGQNEKGQISMNKPSTHALCSEPRRSLTIRVLIPVLCLFIALPVAAQSTLQAIIVKHLTTSRDFTLKVAEDM